MGIYTTTKSFYGIIIAEEDNDGIENDEEIFDLLADDLAVKYNLKDDMFGNLVIGDSCGFLIGTENFQVNPSSVEGFLDYVETYSDYTVDDEIKNKIQDVDKELKARGYTTHVGAWLTTCIG